MSELDSLQQPRFFHTFSISLKLVERVFFTHYFKFPAKSFGVYWFKTHIVILNCYGSKMKGILVL